MSFPRYPEYKDSGIEWLGEVPGHWELKRVRYLIQQSYDGMKIGPFGSQLTSQMLAGSGYKVFGQENVIADDFTRGDRFISEEKFQELNVYEIKPGDILITMMGTSGRCAIAPDNITTGIMDSHLLRMRVTDSFIKPQLLQLLIDESPYVAHQIRILGKGSIMHGLNSSIIRDLLIALPSLQEQTTILSFLYRETAKIDALIAEQQRLIELLKEKRQAVISHAVTKGLNPDAPMKDSSIEWLGEVPAHWLVSPIKYHVLLRSGGTPSKQNLGYWDGDIPWASAKDLKPETLSDTIDHITSLAIESGQASLVSVDSVLVVVRGMILAKTFPVTVITVPMAINQDLKAIEGCNELDSKFLAWWLRGTARESMSRTDEAGHGTKALRMDAWTSMPITIPPPIEQFTIISFLDSETTKLDTLTTEAQRAIALLKERRSALISAAVTGKIDVRRLAEAC